MMTVIAKLRQALQNRELEKLVVMLSYVRFQRESSKALAFKVCHLSVVFYCIVIKMAAPWDESART